MKRLTRIDLEGRAWAVKWRRIGKFMGGYPVLGEANDTALLIDPDQTLRAQRTTLAHESLHMLCRRANIERSVITVKQEEYIVSKLEDWFVVLLRDNPGFVEFLTRSDGG